MKQTPLRKIANDDCTPKGVRIPLTSLCIVMIMFFACKDEAIQHMDDHELSGYEGKRLYEFLIKHDDGVIIDWYPISEIGGITGCVIGYDSEFVNGVIIEFEIQSHIRRSLRMDWELRELEDLLIHEIRRFSSVPLDFDSLIESRFNLLRGRPLKAFVSGPGAGFVEWYPVAEEGLIYACWFGYDSSFRKAYMVELGPTIHSERKLDMSWQLEELLEERIDTIYRLDNNAPD